MKFLIRILIFTITSLFIVMFISYVDEGNASNYTSLFDYMLTDAYSDMFITDTGMHGWTYILITFKILSYYIIRKSKISQKNQVLHLAGSVVIAPFLIIGVGLTLKAGATIFHFIF